MADLIHYPAEDLAAAKLPHIKSAPFVKFRKKKNLRINEDGGSRVEEIEEEHYFPLSTAPNIEALMNMQAAGCKFISFGNFPKNKTYAEIAGWLKLHTGMVLENEASPEYKALEAKILAKAATKQAEADVKAETKTKKTKELKESAEVIEAGELPEGL